ncbi:alkaline phosphatase D family protein [Limnobacter sp.]|uniref:alkaline phosphatase D family protein n=1 Tax=Limnobacter sp. TaxID=2003368 RepID=UPI0035141DA9
MSILLAGPILRRMQPNRLTLWLATTQAIQWRLSLMPAGHDAQVHEIHTQCNTLPVGEKLFIHLIDLPLEVPLPTDTWVAYDLSYQAPAEQAWMSVAQAHPHLLYPGKSQLGFVIKSRLNLVLHGSCRKPHFGRKQGSPAGDGLARADQYLQEHLNSPSAWPAALVLSGDQIYTDDVAGPMLVAIHSLLKTLDLPDETLPGSQVPCGEVLHNDTPFYYQREQLLPKTKADRAIQTVLFKGVRKPVFTTDNARNHLITLAETLAMYLLVWSPLPWRYASTTMPNSVPIQFEDRYEHQLAAIEQFVSTLEQVQRAMAHLPVAMMFDDHDITDDWNLSAEWEDTAYGHPFSKRIVGNALLAYVLCQGWGNAPEQFPADMLMSARRALQRPGSPAHDQLIDRLIAVRGWRYTWPTQPPLMVVDTRTNRWRSEFNPAHPSGLMDWESLSDLQQQLIGHHAVVLVSPAPMFGVKLIEAIQKVFTWFGKPLMVDAENWMAHRGAASTLLNLFRHGKTPNNFVVLSGDVHYSFVYDVELRGRASSPNIWQITSSGLRNEFPAGLLNVLDRLNRWLYAPWSPLNWFTKRRRMRVVPRKPSVADRGERLVNGSGIGLLELDEHGAPTRMVQLLNDGQTVHFETRAEQEAH